MKAVSTRETPTATATAVVDGGVENLNSGVDGLIELGWLRRVAALKDATF